MADKYNHQYDLSKSRSALSPPHGDFLEISNTAKPRVILSDRIAGCVLGFAIGDSIGAPLEFSKGLEKGLDRITDYAPSPRKGLNAGQFTDDTQHLIIGLQSLIEYHGDLNLQDQADRLVQWYVSGDARSMGRTTQLAIENLLSGCDYGNSGINNIKNCGSLAISRLIPVALMSAINRGKYKIQRTDIKNILSITHAHRNVANMGELFNYFIQEIMYGKNPSETLDMILSENELLNKRIRNKLAKVKKLSKSDKDPMLAIEEIGNSGFVEDVVYSSIYGALKGNDFREAILISANGGGDTDSRAAFTGALYGLYVGEPNIPSDLKVRLESKSELEEMARQLFYLRK